MAYVILAALLVVAVAITVRPFLASPSEAADAPLQEDGREGYREDVRQDYLMGKIAPEEYEAALKEEGDA